jgi:phosphatidylserine decarboxylase
VSLRARGQVLLSHTVGWLADRWIPPFLRAPLYRAYARGTGANLAEMHGALRDHPSLGAFFVRRLREGARMVDPDLGTLPSPVDGLVQASSTVERGHVVEAKGRTYALRDLLAGVGEDVELEGGHQFTLYLGPKDYHRIHAPFDTTLVEARHVPGRRWSVQPKVLAQRNVLAVNERVVLRLVVGERTCFMVLVGALIVGRIRVVGLERFPDGPLAVPRRYTRGEELGRFEMGSTVVLVTPPGALEPGSALASGAEVRLGQRLAGWRA